MKENCDEIKHCVDVAEVAELGHNRPNHQSEWDPYVRCISFYMKISEINNYLLSFKFFTKFEFSTDASCWTLCKNQCTILCNRDQNRL